MNRFTRREATLLLSALPVWLAAPAAALTDASARALVEQVVAEINAVIGSGKSEAGMIRDFEAIFARWADVPTIARQVLGPDARSASAAELQAFGEAFRGYIARRYGRRFREFVGGRVVVRDVRAVKTFHEVQTVAELRGQAPFGVSFLVSDRSGSPRFFDLVIDGISLLKTERTEIGAMLDRRRGDIGALIADLRQAG